MPGQPNTERRVAQFSRLAAQVTCAFRASGYTDAASRLEANAMAVAQQMRRKAVTP